MIHKDDNMKNKKITLKQAWTQCLKMWKWIAENYVDNKTNNTDKLKTIWIKENKIRYSLQHHCFFCQYDKEQKGESYCDTCPGKLVSRRFQCEVYSSYNWQSKPKQFHKKLLELHEKFIKEQKRK